MKMKPILFSTTMVQAILDGRKKMTRRVIKPQPLKPIQYYLLVHNEVVKMPIAIQEYSKVISKYSKKGYTQIYTKGPLQGMIGPLCKYKVGDVLWVRETWQHTKVLNINPEDENYGYVYKADDQPWEDYEGWKWKPSLFMPLDACRLFLKITNIRAERLQDITEEDAIYEGIINRHPFGFTAFGIDQCESAKESFKYLWSVINGEKSWEENPFVWVIQFERYEQH
jgi:hypothetical protein